MVADRLCRTVGDRQWVRHVGVPHVCLLAGARMASPGCHVDTLTHTMRILLELVDLVF